MRSGADDLVYFSEYVDDPALAYGRRAAGAADLAAPPPGRLRRASDERSRGLPSRRTRAPPRAVDRYDIREFVY